MKRWSLAGGLTWLALLGVALRGPAARGEAPAEAASAEAIEFRRVFAPADRIKDWPKGIERYLPIEASEFERLVQAANQNDVVRRAWMECNSRRPSIGPAWWATMF